MRLQEVNITQDERDLLRDFLANSGWKVFLKVLDSLCSDIERRVLTFDLDEGSKDALAVELAKAKGARLLIKKIQQLKGEEKRPKMASRK